MLAKTPRGWASISCLILLTSAVQLLSLGIIGEYLARIFQEVKGRPTFLMRGSASKKTIFQRIKSRPKFLNARINRATDRAQRQG